MAESYPNGWKTQWEKEKLLLFPQCFQGACFPGASNGVIVWEWVNTFSMTNFRLFQTKTELSEMTILDLIKQTESSQQEGQNGPGLLTGIFERTIVGVFFGSFREEEFLYVYKVQVAPIHQSHVYRPIKISQTFIENGHTRNISVKLFQNLTIGFREKEFLRISSFSYSASSPHSPEPCLLMDQTFTINF